MYSTMINQVDSKGWRVNQWTITKCGLERITRILECEISVTSINHMRICMIENKLLVCHGMMFLFKSQVNQLEISHVISYSDGITFFERNLLQNLLRYFFHFQISLPRN